MSKNTTKSQIAFLGVKVKPKYLSWDKKTERINIRVTDEKGNKARTTISSKKTDGDLQALFYAAAGIRNYFLKHSVLPDTKQRKVIIKRAMHTQKNIDQWYKSTAEEMEDGPKVYTRAPIQLVDDKTEIDIDLCIGTPEANKFLHFRGRPRKRLTSRTENMKYIYLKTPTSIQVVVPGKVSKSFGSRRYGSINIARTEALKYRDSLNPEL